MARIVFFMSLLFATFQASADRFVLFNATPATYEYSHLTITAYFKDQNNTLAGTKWCSATPFSGVDHYDDDTSISGILEYDRGDCEAKWVRTNGSFAAKLFNTARKYIDCPAGQRPQDYYNTECIDYQDVQCPANEVVDPITGNCGCADGFERDDSYTCQETQDDDDIGGGDGSGGDGSGGDGSGGDGSGGDGSGNTNYDCDSSESCLTEAQGICSADNREVMEYQYQGAGYYHYSCGYNDYNCGDGFSWDRANQVCKSDQDQDGTPDDQDPDPQNPEENGDRDGDGVPDAQDSHPDDPNQWNGNPETNHNGQNVNPIGESDTFNDSAIVEALNQNTQTTNTTNTKLDSLLDQGSITNDELGAINEGIQGISDALGQEEPSGKGSGDLNDAVGEALDDFEQMTIDEFNQGIDDKLLVEQGDLPTIETAFGGLELEKCEDITNDLFTIELCSLAPRINPILYWAFACFTVIACFQNVSSTLRKETK